MNKKHVILDDLLDTEKHKITIYMCLCAFVLLESGLNSFDADCLNCDYSQPLNMKYIGCSIQRTPLESA